ncbi:MAG: hypothetical protein KF906_04715 [Actinobacteria bacterium]|nr:hypothetical protein [Actinomycetota bacterium]
MGEGSKVPKDTRWSVFAVGLITVALLGLFATIAGPGSSRHAGGTDVAAGAPVTAPETPATTSTPAETTTTATPTAEVTTSTTEAPTTTAAPPTTTTPPATVAPTTPTTPPPTTAAPRSTPTTTPTPSPAERQRLARDAAVVAHTTGLSVDGYASADVLFAPALRASLDAITRSAAYRAAGCNQWVTEVVDGPATATTFGFSLRIERACARVPTSGGRQLPLVTGAYTTVTVGPSAGGSWWAVALTSE